MSRYLSTGVRMMSLVLIIALVFSVSPLPVAHAAVTTIYLTAGSSWTVPGNWNSSSNSVEVIGGGGATTINGAGTGGGGGGAYSKVSNLSLSGTVTYSVGAAGAVGTAGGDTYFNGASLGASSVGAKGGSGGVAPNPATTPITGATGGASGSGVGTTKFSGGAGGGNGVGNFRASMGGGGAAGPSGAGKNGGDAVAGGGGGGGGGADGGSSTAGASPSAGVGGTGGSGSDGTTGGTGGASGGAAGNAGTAGTGAGGAGGGGGGGSAVSTGAGGAGGAGKEWDATHGAGGGGAGGSGSSGAGGGVGGAGGTYGGGGGGGGGGTSAFPAGGVGGQGLIIITYTPLTVSGTYNYSRAITIDHTKVPNTDQTNFPVLVSGTYNGSGGIADLRSTGNGGKAQSSSGYDINFYTSSNCTGLMSWEVESYSASTGVVNYWVKVPTVSATTDSVFYMCYGNSSITFDPSNPTDVWDSNYVAVYHLPNGSSLTTNDSTTNGNAASNNNSVTAITGLFGGGASMNGTTQYLETPGFTEPSSITLEAWIKPNSAGGGVFDELGQVAPGGGWHDNQIEVETNNTVKACIWIGSLSCVTAGSGIVYASGWYQVVMRYNVSGTQLIGFMNGVASSPSTVTKQSPTPGPLAYYSFGNSEVTNAGNSSAYSGGLDEIRISSSARSSDYIATEYNNYSSPSTFYTIGAESSSGGGSTSRNMRLFEGFRLKLVSGRLILRQQ